MRIKPSYRRGVWLGFHIEINGEPIGKAFAQYKLAALALRSLS